MSNSRRDDDEKLRAELRGLAEATPPPSEDFAGAVMRQVALRPKPRLSAWQRLWAPRTITLRVRPLPALATGLAAALLLVLGARLLPRPSPTLARNTIDAPVVPPSGPTLVRFSLHADGARHVSLAGDFNGWRTDAIDLVRGPDGTWSATVPLARGSWSYSFVVDGKWVADPGADAWRDDGFGGRNAIVRIGG